MKKKVYVCIFIYICIYTYTYTYITYQIEYKYTIFKHIKYNISYCPNTQNILRDGLAGASHPRRLGAAAAARAVCSLSVRQQEDTVVRTTCSGCRRTCSVFSNSIFRVFEPNNTYIYIYIHIYIY